MQFDAQRASYGAQYRIAQDHIITANELSVGRIWIDAGGHQPTHDTTIVDISVHPRVQGHGIGTKVLRSVLNSAQTRGSLVVLHVAVGNRAQELYRRLGFVDGGGEGMHERMTWRAPAKADTTDGSEERRASGLVGVR